jgi:phage tail-like protein
MDANGQRFWLALGGTAWRPDVPGSLELRPDRLRLASRSDAVTYPEDATQAEARLARVPMAADSFGTFAFYDAPAQAIRATGALQREDAAGAKRPEKLSEAQTILPGLASVTDLALAHDGLLYVAVGGEILIHDVRGRLTQTRVRLNGFQAWRLTSNPPGGVWVLDRANRKLARLVGRPWPPPPDTASPPPTAFLPLEENSNPPRLVLMETPWLEAGEDPVALACSPEGRLAVLLWSATGARVRLVNTEHGPGPKASLRGVQRPFSLAWISNERFAVLAAGVNEALVYAWLEADLDPSGEVFPLRDHDGGPLLHGVSLPVPYACQQPSDTPNDPLLWLRPLVSVSLPAFATAARGTLLNGFDSGQAGTAWHRLYVDAEIPPDTSFTIYAAASDTAEDPAAITDANDWHAHHFGGVAGAATAEPRAAWMRQPSELPGHTGFTGEAPEPNRSGLFTVLLQRSNRPVRTLRGRFLHLRIELRGNLRSTPCVHAARAYGPRFAYADKYLPALYRETLFGPEADAVAPGQPATRPDFLGRFLANFEGVLTPLEDNVAGSWRLTDPRATPDHALAWLGAWIGVGFEPWFPVARRRAQLRHAPALFRARGTLRGLRLALDVATGGGVGQGRIVVLEDHWFRRTLQTVLGLNLDGVDDPLLGGPVVSGNSKVGETLFLSEEGMEKKFLALFDASIQLKAAERRVVEEFFASLAHRVTIVVHEEAAPEERRLIERIAALEAPAHIAVRVKTANRDFLLGLSALLRVDTYLRPEPPPEPVEVDASTLGGGALLLRPPALDPRLEGTSS